MNIQPFSFDRLKKYTQKEAEIFSWLAKYFPAPGLAPIFVDKLTEALKKYLGLKFRIRFESVFEAPFEKFVAGLPERFVCFAVSLTPLSEKVIIELDSDFAFAVIDKMLGGEGSVPRVARPQTPLEEGVLQFFGVKILKELASFMKQAPYQFRLDKIVTQTSILTPMIEAEKPMILLTFRLRLGDVEGYVRLGLVHPLLLALASQRTPLMPSELTGVASAEQNRFAVFEHFRTVLWGEVGRVSLSAAELRQLDTGDIILFDESYSDWDGKKISGTLRLKVGEGTSGGIEGELLEANGEVKVKLDRVFVN